MGIFVYNMEIISSIESIVWENKGGVTMNLFGSTFQTLEHSFDYATAKNKTLANNIANVDTPNYKAKDVAFKDILADELNGSTKTKQTQPEHISTDHQLHNKFQSYAKSDVNYNHNGNNVDMDKEMTSLAKNQLYYQSLVERMNDKFHDLQTVVRGGSN